VVGAPADLHPALCRIVDGYVGMFAEIPAMRGIWKATQAEQREIDDQRLLSRVWAEFTLVGTPYQVLNGGPEFKHSEAASISVMTKDQAAAGRAMQALMGMKKIDVTALEAAAAA
jgi:predicted 3-demethylubiquinone-9 3-methyltransferase (glyoxalase superfamily)